MHAFSLIFSEAQQSAIGKTFGKAIHSRNSGYDVSVRLSVRPYKLSGWRWHEEVGQPLGTEVFGQFFLKGNRVAATAAKMQHAFSWPAGNHISDEQWDKEQERAGKSTREEVTKFEKCKLRKARKEKIEEKM